MADRLLRLAGGTEAEAASFIGEPATADGRISPTGAAHAAGTSV
ncbi:hypothetical protein ACFSL4_11290 [Streptomyces caeni]|uniref:Uncharacterized protein n=1 Tax=Streptomyces caeni TaxID=2307231 RepID=A0ABW4IPZ6_9ACTN